MNATTIAGIVGGVAGLGLGIGLHLHGRDAPARGEQAARTEWNEWKTQLDAEFPDRKLASAADEARFVAFLKQHPAPKWINVKHEGLRAISIEAWDPVGPKDAMGGGLSLTAIGGGVLGGMAGSALRYSSRSTPILQVLGGAMAAGGGILGGTLIAGSFFNPKPDSLKAEIEASEWHVPGSWTD